MANITWKTEDGNEITADVEDGLNLMEAATANNVPHIEGECGGCLSCATCHVFVNEEWLAKTGEVDEIEDTMLEMTDVERRVNSR
ncbi:MAG: 2Fe-2S iron-sulfur cluster-binding protein, partial [Gammaproteobacteria bacterium]